MITHIQANLIHICQNVFGRRLIQCVLEYGNVEKRSQIYDKINESLMSLLQDRHGNYVVQSLIGMANFSTPLITIQLIFDFLFDLTEKCSPANRYRMVQFIFDDLIYLSMNRYSSNVVVAAIDLAEAQQREQAIRTISSFEPE